LYCGFCKFFIAGRDDKRGFCSLFELQKPKFNNAPKRCNEMFAKGFTIGGDLVLVLKEK
jgi:hypothetical protein